MEILNFITNHWEYIVSAAVSAVFLVVNIIQAIRCHDKNKLKDALCRIPEMIRYAEDCYMDVARNFPQKVSTTTTVDKGIYKKSLVESFLIVQYGKKFANKYMKLFDDAIEDILNTPQKKGESNDGLSKENEER